LSVFPVSIMAVWKSLLFNFAGFFRLNHKFNFAFHDSILINMFYLDAV
jgi:hypothetical protein